MQVCVIDGRGGGIGSRLIERLRTTLPGPYDIVALGTNRRAAQVMAQAGATYAAAGEQAIVDAVRAVEVILGSLNVVLPGALCGEVTPLIADAILRAPARKLLLPLNRFSVEVVGSGSPTLEPLLDEVISRVRSMLDRSCKVAPSHSPASQTTKV